MWRKALCYFLAAVSVAGACLALLFAAASLLDRQNTASSARAAYRLVPFSADYVTRLAGWKPDERAFLLHKAVQLDPFHIPAWLQLGFDSEYRERNASRAESFYLQAAAVDKMFLPKWTLTNFYFRQGNKAEFLRWAHAALAITPYAADPIFAELSVLAQLPEQREAAVPDRPAILDHYLMFLFQTQQWKALPSVLERLVKAAGLNPGAYGLTDVIGPMLDRLLATGDGEGALRMWSALWRAQWIALPTPDAVNPLTNGQFKQPVWTHGFDWVPTPSNGVRFTQDIHAGELRFSLNGDEGEDIVLLRQWLPLSPGGTYELAWHSVQTQLDSPSGLFWHLSSGLKQADSADFAANPDGRWAFVAGGNKGPSLLTLQYRRPLGTTRARGDVRLSTVSVQKP